MLPDGLTVRFVHGQLRLFGLNALNPKTKDEVIKWAKRNRSEIFKSRFKELLNLAGAKLCEDKGAASIVFNPHLAGEVEDPKRWALALELEALFFAMDKEALS